MASLVDVLILQIIHTAFKIILTNNHNLFIPTGKQMQLNVFFVPVPHAENGCFLI
jgi:hypothetical protein